MSNIATNNIELLIKTPRGYEPFIGVARVDPTEACTVLFDDGISFTCALTHRVLLANSQFATARSLRPGTVVAGDKNRTVVCVTLLPVQPLYDIVETSSNLVYTNGVVSHNCSFITNDTQLFDGMVLANMWKTVEHNVPLFTKYDVDWFKPIGHNKTYLVGMDVATGTGLDYTTIEVFEFPSLEQVAEYRTNDVRPSECYKKLKRVLLELEANNTVYFTVENNGVGEAIITLFEVDETPPTNSEFVSEDGAKRRGMVTTQRSKIKASLTLKELLQRHMINVHSPILVTEMKSYVRSKGSYAAKSGSTDDLIAAVLLILRLIEDMTTYDDNAYRTLYGPGMTSLTYDEYDETEAPAAFAIG